MVGNDNSGNRSKSQVTTIIPGVELIKPTGDGDHDGDDAIGQIKIIRKAKSGEVFRGVSLAPQDSRDDDMRDWSW